MVGKDSGFTLIELMIVVVIVGIISAFAVPTYQGYVVQSQLNRALGELSAYKSAVEERLVQNGGVVNSEIGYSPSSLTTGTAATDIATFNADGSGHLQVTMGGKAHDYLSGLVLRIERTVSGSWSCVIDTSGAANWVERFSPADCLVI